ncbi:MAG: aspartate aminotransferase family protein [Anaerolineales bacterium]
MSLIFPPAGRSKDDVLDAMRAARAQDVCWQDGRAFSLVYHAGQDVEALSKEAYTMFFSENGLSPMAFPSLRHFEAEVVAMSAALLGGNGQVVGNMTSGGTESILVAVYAAREWARAHRPEITRPEMVLPASAHPAFDKAAHYFGVRAVRVPVADDFRADPAALRAAIGPSTILLVASAPSYPQGVVDPVAEIAALAQAHGLLCHVDACVGGFMLPFVRKLGYPVPPFDFSVPGVTSISADLHKYGYAAKGASVVLYRNRELRRRAYFVHTDWSGGVYASPALGGTRPGGAIAAAWAVMNYLGEEGYLRLAGEVMRTCEVIRNGVQAIPGLKILGQPVMSVMALASDEVDIYAVGDALAARGWHLDRQQFPPSLHLTVHHGHVAVADQFLQDLAACVALVRRPALPRLMDAALVRFSNLLVRLLPASWVSRLMRRAGKWLGGGGEGRSAAMYGMLGTLPNRGDLRELVLDMLERMSQLAE